MPPVDNQAVTSRFGSANWLTDFVTPDNPDVKLAFKRITENLVRTEDKIVALWRAVAQIPYTETIKASLTIEGQTFRQNDTWLYPAEVMFSPKANCANKSFLLASLLRNMMAAPDVQVVMGHLLLDGIGAHSWVEINLGGEEYILEGTQPNLSKALVPKHLAAEYEGVLAFNDKGVMTMDEATAPGHILNEHFSFCAVPWLKDYLCERCLELEA